MTTFQTEGETRVVRKAQSSPKKLTCALTLLGGDRNYAEGFVEPLYKILVVNLTKID